AEPSAPELMRRLPLRPVRIEQRVVLVGIAVRPAIDRDRSDVASRVEARRTQHAAELVADPLFEGHETGGEQLGTPSTVLITLRQSGAAWCPDQLNQNRLIRGARRPIGTNIDGWVQPDARMEAAGTMDTGDSQSCKRPPI